MGIPQILGLVFFVLLLATWLKQWIIVPIILIILWFLIRFIADIFWWGRDNNKW